MSAITAYPLSWPAGWKRTPASQQKHGHFGKRRKVAGRTWASLEDLTVYEAVGRVLDELERMGVRREAVVISTNLQVRLDGLPRADSRRPADHGAAVYWEEDWNSERRCMAIDLYFKVEDNLAAIAATLEAMRAIERHGGAAVLQRAFTGFTALPAPAARTWRQVLAIEGRPDAEILKTAYRLAASKAHPDKGGSDALMAEVNAAYQKAKEELGL